MIFESGRAVASEEVQKGRFMKILRAITIVAGLAAASFTTISAEAAPLGATGGAIGKAAQSPAVTDVRFGGFHGGRGFGGRGFHGGWRGGYGGWRGGRGWGWAGAGLGVGLATGALLGSGYYYGRPAYYPTYDDGYYDDQVYYVRPRYRRVYHVTTRGAPCRIVSHGHVYRRPGCR